MKNEVELSDPTTCDVFTPIYHSYASKIIDRTETRTGKILDIGCGGGFLAFALLDLGNFESATFLDISEAPLEEAKLRAEAFGYLESECEFVVGDACDLSNLEENTYSLVVSRGSLQFWPDPEKALRAIHRVLKPGGFCYIGGGVGVTDRQTARMDVLMSRYGHHGHKHPPIEQLQKVSERRKRARTNRCKDFAEVFHDLNCSYALINSSSEGGWYIFRKDDEINIW